MNIDQYNITFPYGATSAPYSATHPHRGNDLPLNYEPVLIKGFQIGISGQTGLADGPHVHVQAGTDPNAQQTIDSKPYIGQPGTVFKTGTASEWGNFVCVKVGDVYVYYCHLSQITCNTGDIINKEEEMPNQGDVINVYKRINNKTPDQHEIQTYTTKPWNAADGLYYGKVDLDIQNLQKALRDANTDDAEKIKQIKEILGE